MNNAIKMRNSGTGHGVHVLHIRTIYAAALVMFCTVYMFGENIPADPSNYKTKLGELTPGDRLELAAGDYPDGLSIANIHGNPAEWIIITGPLSGTPAAFLGDPGKNRNTIEITDSSYLAIENLTIDGQDIPAVFGISAKGGSGNTTHHIRIENCTLVRHSGGGSSQQTAGISTKCPTYAWIIRNNIIRDAGTGMYLGNSDGNEPFIGGMISGNLVEDTLGYCIQIKHQNVRPSGIGLPDVPQKTVIRDNVFIKTDRPSPDGNRPNLLLGHFPVSGDGADDVYEVFGNFFFHNPRESLMQAEGRLIIHDNIFVDTAYTALLVQNHNDVVKTAYVYHNTVYSAAQGIRFGSTATVDHAVVGNAVFADTPISGSISNAAANVTDSAAHASGFMTNPNTVLGSMDFYPITGMLSGTSVDMSPFTGHTCYDRDFNGTVKDTFIFRGAYAGEDSNSGWALTNERKSGLINYTPAVYDSYESTAKGTAVDITLSAADPDGDPVSCIVQDYPDHGILADDDGDTHISYIPDVGYGGTDMFTFSAHDGSAGSGTAAVTITVGSKDNNSGDSETAGCLPGTPDGSVPVAVFVLLCAAGARVICAKDSKAV